MASYPSCMQTCCLTSQKKHEHLFVVLIHTSAGGALNWFHVMPNWPRTPPSPPPQLMGFYPHGILRADPSCKLFS